MIELNILIFIFLLLLICLTNNAIHALLSLILIFINFAILLFYLNNIFLGFSYILVYIGAICVLFLYIILVLHVRVFNVINKTNLFFLLIILSFSLIYIATTYFHIPSDIGNTFSIYTTDISLLASYLFVTHSIYLVFAMVLLLVALILALFLSSNEINLNHISCADSFIQNPSKIQRILNAYSDVNQRLHNRVINWLLSVKYLRPLILFFFEALFFYKFLCTQISERFPHTNLNLFFILISLVMSRLHIAGVFIVFALIVARLEWSFIKMARFYRRDPTRLTKDFPEHTHKRHMRKAAQVIIEAAKEPVVHAVALAVGGAVAWKALDVIDSGRNAETADKDRASAERTADKDRASAERIADKQRQHEKEESTLAREEEGKQRQLDRESAERVASSTSPSSESDTKAESVLSSIYEPDVLSDFVFNVPLYSLFFLSSVISVLFLLLLISNILFTRSVSYCEPLNFQAYVQEPNFTPPATLESANMIKDCINNDSFISLQNNEKSRINILNYLSEDLFYLKKYKIFKYYFSLFKRIITLLIICVYGFLYEIYFLIIPIKIHNYLKENPHIITCFQGFALTVDWVFTCSFHLFLHSFLYRVEIICDNLERNPDEFFIISSALEKMRRSSICSFRFMARGGSSGLGGIGGPKGNGYQVLAWFVVAGTSIGVYNFRKYKTYQIKAQTQRHDIDTKAQTQRHETDSRTQTQRHETDRKFDVYTKDKETWDKASRWGRGNPPKPPY